jgi:mRNA-degrading endonuclease RelE of RelBE toxin-antitoxin system
MSTRRQRRAVQQAGNKRLEKLELKKKAIIKEAIKEGAENPFDEFYVAKKFGPIRYGKTGLKLAPLRRLKI